MSKNTDFDTQLLLDQISEDFRNDLYIVRPLVANTRLYIWKNTGGAEAFGAIKHWFAKASKCISDAVKRYAEFKGLKCETPEEFREAFLALEAERKHYITEIKSITMGYFNPATQVTKRIHRLYRSFDDTISQAQTMYKILDSSDDRFAKPQMPSVIKAFMNPEWDDNPKDLDTVKDIDSQEYGKEVCKRSRMAKQRVVSLANEYFGKRSILSDLGIADIALS